MEETIGHAAGQIWEVLSSHKRPVSVTEVPKITKIKTQLAYQALGWLAREGKLIYHTSGTKTSVSLATVACTC